MTDIEEKYKRAKEEFEKKREDMKKIANDALFENDPSDDWSIPLPQGYAYHSFGGGGGGGSSFGNPTSSIVKSKFNAGDIVNHYNRYDKHPMEVKVVDVMESKDRGVEYLVKAVDAPLEFFCYEEFLSEIESKLLKEYDCTFIEPKCECGAEATQNSNMHSTWCPKVGKS